MGRTIFVAVLFVVHSAWCFSQDSFALGEELFMQNKPQEAAVHFETAIAENPGDARAFLFLGIAYEQMGKMDEAITVYRQILGSAGDLAANIASNLGNIYFAKGSIAEAEAMYTQALNTDRTFAAAFLGRANARVKTGALQEAIADYEQYLQVNPKSPQRASIERLVAFIKTEFAEAERRRLVAEEQARAEAERRRRLLEEVSASLQSAAAGSQGLSAGAENVEGYEGEFELE